MVADRLPSAYRGIGDYPTTNCDVTGQISNGRFLGRKGLAVRYCRSR